MLDSTHKTATIDILTAQLSVIAGLARSDRPMLGLRHCWSGFIDQEAGTTCGRVQRRRGQRRKRRWKVKEQWYVEATSGR